MLAFCVLQYLLKCSVVCLADAHIIELISHILYIACGYWISLWHQKLYTHWKKSDYKSCVCDYQLQHSKILWLPALLWAACTDWLIDWLIPTYIRSHGQNRSRSDYMHYTDSSLQFQLSPAVACWDKFIVILSFSRMEANMSWDFTVIAMESFNPYI